jgi:hypothetical protein
LYGELTRLVTDGTLHARTQQPIRVERVRETVAAANANDPDGKILIAGAAI